MSDFFLSGDTPVLPAPDIGSIDYPFGTEYTGTDVVTPPITGSPVVIPTVDTGLFSNYNVTETAGKVGSVLASPFKAIYGAGESAVTSVYGAIKSGAESITGGIKTTYLYLVGGILLIGVLAVVLLGAVSKVQGGSR